MAFPTPGFSEAPTIAIEVGERKIFFKFAVLNRKFNIRW
jgi:hypothetical protein